MSQAGTYLRSKWTDYFCPFSLPAFFSNALIAVMMKIEPLMPALMLMIMMMMIVMMMMMMMVMMMMMMMSGVASCYNE